MRPPLASAPTRNVEQPAQPTTPTVKAEPPVTPSAPFPAPVVAKPAEMLLPPPVVSRVQRVQFNSKIEIELKSRVEAFVKEHNSTLQGVLEAALTEYMTRRGW